jgi:4-hydroxy-4-methyl-2-oxoglutarate aldolase
MAARRPLGAAVTGMDHGVLLKLKRWSSCATANGIERSSGGQRRAIVNRDEVTDFMPEMGAMVGVAMTVTMRASDEAYKKAHSTNAALYREYLASVAGPKIVVVQDLDAPVCYGSMWGEVGANFARTLGCVGTITDGAIRDLDEMRNAGFKALARRLAVSHAFSCQMWWGKPVEVFGTMVRPGQLLHADKHGFVILPEALEERARLIDLLHEGAG